MDHINYIESYMGDSIKVKTKLLADKRLVAIINTVAIKLCDIYKNGNKVLLAGNGGSAADSQHIAAEFVSRFYFDRPGLPALALSTDTSMLTAIGNDYGFDHLFSRQVQAQAKAGDVLIGISTSGNSKNIVKAFEIARTMGVYTVALCGEGGVLADLADSAICVPSKSTPYIQECHICIGHVLCGIVEKVIFKDYV